MSDAPRATLTAAELTAYQRIRDLVAQAALSMIDFANHKPANRAQKPKVGGHQASCMSSVDLLCALYLHVLRPADRVCVKPHAAPVLYALAHLCDVVETDALDTLREFGGLQPYPTSSKNPRWVDYTSSSEALGPAATIYDAYGAIHEHRALGRPDAAAPVFYAHLGDGELTEGQIDESLYDAGRWRLDNLVWIVDMNRQSLDRVMDDSGRLDRWVEAKFRAQDWEVISVPFGARALELFALPGCEGLREGFERLDDVLWHPLLLLRGAALRFALGADGPRPEGALGELAAAIRGALGISARARKALTRALATRDDAWLEAAVGHLGGHDLPALIEAFCAARAVRGRPAVIVAHTVKGYQTSQAAHPENHGALLPEDEVAGWGASRGVAAGARYPRPAAGSAEALHLARVRERFVTAAEPLWAEAPAEAARAALAEVKVPGRRVTSSGEAFQSLNLALLRSDVAPWMQFCAPDVGHTTHLGPVIRQTGVFAPRDLPDVYAFLREAQQTSFDFHPSPTGQFHALGIAEGNAMLWAYAFGRRRLRGEARTPLLPVVTVYDKFFERAFNQLDYAVYAGARFVAVGVPSGSGLSRETATHQSLQTPRMMMDLPGIVAFEPAFAADVEAVYLHALGQLWDEAGEAVYLRLSTQPLEQPDELPPDHAAAAIRGAWWLVGQDDRRRREGPNVLFIASGRKLREVRMAAAQLDDGHGIGSRILNVTSYERLWRDWDAFSRDPDAWDDPERSYALADLFDDASLNLPLIIVGDHVASVAEWLPGALQRVRGHRFLGPRANGMAGDLDSLDRFHGMGVEDIVAAARAELAWRAAPTDHRSARRS
ncbi:MAG: 1-deoxy-D-xylulose-5-phosphate synthase N-terminal domain-containing protein [Myxococcota bacterium]